MIFTNKSVDTPLKSLIYLFTGNGFFQVQQLYSQRYGNIQKCISMIEI